MNLAAAFNHSTEEHNDFTMTQPDKFHKITDRLLGLELFLALGQVPGKGQTLQHRFPHYLPSKTCAIPPAAPANRSFSVRCKLPGSTSRSVIFQRSSSLSR